MGAAEREHATARESQWHPSQTEQLHPGGILDLTFQVGALLEITPRVLSWGASVEVLPPQLHRSVAESARAQAARYPRQELRAMPDAWINRLVVSGNEAEASAFERAAARPEPGPPTSLSFVRLQTLLPEEDQGGLDEPHDPWDNSYGPSVPPPRREPRQDPGAVGLAYSFILARYEPDELLIRVSRLFPNLCFVLGRVAPSNDEQMSRFIKDGQTLIYEA